MTGAKPEIVAFHLPQFHSIPENDRWWGTGFTEWVNTRKAKPLFSEHNQPRTPLGGNYYDLSEPAAIRWEMDLARAYGIDAFCYYHYWFHGKLLLQKPLELMRSMDDKIDYFLCWANESWCRAWEGKASEMLVEQEYGDQMDWENHFQYLLPFFQDEHYKKIDGKPIFVIYRTNNIPNCDAMIDYYDEACRRHGFPGIFIVEERNNFQTGKVCASASAILNFEPMFTLTHGRSKTERLLDKIRKYGFDRKTKTNLLVFQYDRIWSDILHRKINADEKSYPGAFVDWDNTARKGKNGTVIIGYTPEKFERYLSLQYRRCAKTGSKFLFINAWNEWGEGTYLEPDERFQLQNLQAVKSVVQQYINKEEHDEGQR